jgi:pilus assembly protein CpaB
MAEATTATILQNVRVLSTGRLIPAGQTVDPRTPKSPVVTLVLAPEDAQKLELAKNEGKISLSLRNPLDASQSPSTGPVTTEVLDPMIGTRLSRARIPRALQELTGQNQKKMEDAQKEKERLEEEARRKKEAEKAGVVVDVYRGDKHVQELFR